MEEAYAQALWKIIEGGPGRAGTPAKKAVELLHQSLVARGRQGLFPKIARAFERLAARKRMGSGITLTVAREKDLLWAHHQAKEVLDSMAAKHADIKEEIDVSLIGGWRVEGQGTLLDESFKRDLLDMYKMITNELPRRSGRGPDPAASGYNRATRN